MCKETFEVVGLDDQRAAYEVEEFLSGVPDVQDAQADFLNNTIVVTYDESKLAEDRVLDHIEHAGCTPSARIDGLVDQLRTKLRTL